MILDVGSSDNFIVMNSPGQSGDPSNKHYDDLFNKWATDQAVPLLYSYEKMKRVVLLPIRD